MIDHAFSKFVDIIWRIRFHTASECKLPNYEESDNVSLFVILLELIEVARSDDYCLLEELGGNMGVKLFCVSETLPCFLI